MSGAEAGQAEPEEAETGSSTSAELAPRTVGQRIRPSAGRSVSWDRGTFLGPANRIRLKVIFGRN